MEQTGGKVNSGASAIGTPLHHPRPQKGTYIGQWACYSDVQ